MSLLTAILISSTLLLALFFGGLGLVRVALWDKGKRALVLALRSLWLHKLRSFLSVLGIIIGTAAVIALMSFGEGSMQDALEEIKRLGATNIIVRSVKPPEDATSQQRSWVAAYGITYQDYDAFSTISTVIRMVPMRIFPQEVRYLQRMHNCRIVATTPKYPEVNTLEMASGRFLNEEDDLNMKNVAVLGSAAAQNLFPFEEPFGHSILLNRDLYVIIGVIKSRMPTGGSGGSQAAEEFNSDVYIPLQTCKVRFGEKVFVRTTGSRSGEKVDLSQVTLTVGETDQVRPAGDVIKDIMLRHPREDYALTVPLDRLEQAEHEKDRFEILLAFIAGISLLVGGIGIMNIMLATVSERTREVGIRRALGAKRRDITLQFLVEAIVQTSVGGLLGTLLGLAIVYLVPFVASEVFYKNIPAKLHVPSIFLALGAAVFVGVFFGLYPARRAALLDPIEALRHE
jgi:putative ABC transport system permease protein